MTDQGKLLSILPPLARLNSWARVPYDQQLDMHEMARRIYRWKNLAIGAAIKLGMAALRIVAVERPCKTCKGTDTYVWQDWNDDGTRRDPNGSTVSSPTMRGIRLPLRPTGSRNSPAPCWVVSNSSA